MDSLLANLMNTSKDTLEKANRTLKAEHRRLSISASLISEDYQVELRVDVRASCVRNSNSFKLVIVCRSSSTIEQTPFLSPTRVLSVLLPSQYLDILESGLTRFGTWRAW